VVDQLRRRKLRRARVQVSCPHPLSLRGLLALGRRFAKLALPRAAAV
jgi:hypothetical protein